MRYFINPQFCLDDGTPKGVNVQLYPDDDPDYWAAEKRFDTMEEALMYTDGMTPILKPLLKVVDPLNYVPTHKMAKAQLERR